MGFELRMMEMLLVLAVQMQVAPKRQVLMNQDEVVRKRRQIHRVKLLRRPVLTVMRAKIGQIDLDVTMVLMNYTRTIPSPAFVALKLERVNCFLNMATLAI